MKNIIEIAHHVDDYVCMWNGVEDIYRRDTGETLPPKFFFVLSSFGGFCYRKTPKSELKRMVALGDGRTGKMYEFLYRQFFTRSCGLHLIVPIPDCRNQIRYGRSACIPVKENMKLQKKRLPGKKKCT